MIYLKVAAIGTLVTVLGLTIILRKQIWRRIRRQLRP